MKNGLPDWGKFGLDNERQPLNPGSTNAEHLKAEQGGCQSVNDNELFADDQVWIKPEKRSFGYFWPFSFFHDEFNTFFVHSTF